MGGARNALQEGIPGLRESRDREQGGKGRCRHSTGGGDVERGDSTGWGGGHRAQGGVGGPRGLR